MLKDLTATQRELADFMSRLSELAYSAAWASDTEYALWRSIQEGPFRYGHLAITEDQTQRLHALSETIGGWIVFDEEAEETFVSLKTWKERYNAHRLRPC